MPADDAIKPAVVAALVKDGWTITDDPLTIEFGEMYLFADLAAERGGERIAVEIKSFPSRSVVADLQQAVGQFVVYRTALQREEPDRTLYLAVSAETHTRVFGREAVRALRDDLGMPLVVVDPAAEEVVTWTR